MKKALLALMVLLTSFTGRADVDEGFRNGLTVNLGATNVCMSGDKATFGYGIGWVAEYNVTSNLFLQSGVTLQNIAHKEDWIQGTINAFYARIPINVGYRFNIAADKFFFLQAGPTIGIGLFGSDIEFTTFDFYNLTTYTTKAHYFGKGMAERFDIALGGKIGVEVNRLQFGIGADYGMMDVFDGGGRNLCVAFSLGIMF